MNKLFKVLLHPGPDRGILDYFESHNREFERKVGLSRKKITYSRYTIVCDHLKSYVNDVYDRPDYPVRQIGLSFVTGFDDYLTGRRKCSRNTVWGYMIVFKHIIKIARGEGLIATDPFSCYINRYRPVDRGYLSKKDLECVMRIRCESKVEEMVRDMFVFSAFTGLSYVDIRNLTSDNVRASSDGKLWLRTHRQKTGTMSYLPLLEVPLRIIDKYGGLSRSGRLFKIPSNTCCNSHLKTIGAMCGIPVHLTFHVGRHTFATLSLNEGVPIETLSRVMGHTNIKTTQIYARIVDQKVSDDMSAFDAGLSELQHSMCLNLEKTKYY